MYKKVKFSAERLFSKLTAIRPFCRGTGEVVETKVGTLGVSSYFKFVPSRSSF